MRSVHDLDFDNAINITLTNPLVYEVPKNGKLIFDAKTSTSCLMSVESELCGCTLSRRNCPSIQYIAENIDVVSGDVVTVHYDKQSGGYDSLSNTVCKFIPYKN